MNPHKSSNPQTRREALLRIGNGFGFTIVSMIIFGILASSLHRRDSRAAAQRAQAPVPAV